MVSIGTLEIAIKADMSDYNRARKTLEQDQGLKFHIVPTVDHKNLVALNRHFSEKEDHHKKVQKGFNQNPLTPKVDLRELESLTKAYQDLSELRDSLTSGTGQVTFVVEHIYKSDNKSSSNKSSNQEDGTLFQEMEAKLNGKIKEVINKVGGVVTAPFAGIGRGFFEGFGQSISKELSKGLLGSLDKELNVNLKTAGSKAANATVDYFFPQMPDKRKYEAKAKEYKQAVKDVDSVISELEKNVKQSTGLSN